MAKWTFNGVEFKVGDKVKIVRKVEGKYGGMGHGKDWHNSWVSTMTRSIGKTDEITDITDNGVSLKGEGFGWPLAALEKQRVVLPTSIFKLVDRAGVVYDVSENFASNYIVMYPGPIPGTIARALVDRQKVIEYVESGFWWTDRSADLDKKEAKLAELVKQHDTLTNEINALEEEIAQW